MKRIIVSAMVICILGSIVFAANENAKRDENRFPTLIGVGATSAEIRNIKCDEGGNLLITLGSGTTVSISATQLSLLQRTTVHMDGPVSISEASLLQRPTAHIDNFPSEYPLPSAQEALLSRPTVHMDAPITVSGLGVLVSTWTSFTITGTTSNSPTISFDLVYFDCIAEGAGGKLNSNFGAGMTLADGLGRSSPAFGNGITSPVINLTDLSVSATYYLDVYGK